MNNVTVSNKTSFLFVNKHDTIVLAKDNVLSGDRNDVPLLNESDVLVLNKHNVSFLNAFWDVVCLALLRTPTLYSGGSGGIAVP